MIFHNLDKSIQKEVEELFTSVFYDSEGEAEGELIGKLSSQLASNIDDNEIFGCGAYESEALIGSCFFSRLRVSEPVQLFMLSPVAVKTDLQGKKIGQGLINYGLEELKKRSCQVVVTYGDPAYYSKVGFQPLTQGVIQSPHNLSMPHGWLGQSLTEGPIPTIKERPVTVKEFNNPLFW
ncbi:MAG: N-acetyltransferase [Granulosicoccus sp.]|nr:N-acetyltransferase [Granulosicoccus sp.]